jgi:hypothetical protein
MSARRPLGWTGMPAAPATDAPLAWRQRLAVLAIRLMAWGCALALCAIAWRVALILTLGG